MSLSPAPRQPSSMSPADLRNLGHCLLCLLPTQCSFASTVSFLPSLPFSISYIQSEREAHPTGGEAGPLGVGSPGVGPRCTRDCPPIPKQAQPLEASPKPMGTEASSLGHTCPVGPPGSTSPLATPPSTLTPNVTFVLQRNASENIRRPNFHEVSLPSQ